MKPTKQLGSIVMIIINEHERKYKEREVVLKRIYNSSNKILDILKEVNKKFNIDIGLSPP